MRRPAVPSFADTVRFHGHSCPGLATGYRISVAALEHLEIARPEDDDLVCVVEHDSCGVDAVQLVAGCTLGKGNLVYRDFGKQVYTFYHRRTDRALRFSAKTLNPVQSEAYDISAIRNRMLEGVATEEDKRVWAQHRGRKIRLILTSAENDVFEVTSVPYVPVKRARIMESVVCNQCGEKVMVTRIVHKDGKVLCIPCAETSKDGVS